MRAVAVLALLDLSPRFALHAQELPRPFATLNYAGSQTTPAPLTASVELSDSTLPRTYWLEGALIGGAVVALLGVSLAGSACSDPDSGGGQGPCWDNVLLGAVIGFGTGASFGGLIGGQFKKARRN
jgi:hypothetical protein